jgi:hypothetical protein
MRYLHDRSCLCRSSHCSRKHDTTRAPCHRPATMPMRLWRNSSRHREEQSRSPAARCDVRQARRVPALPAPAALLTIKTQPESSIKTNRCSQLRQVLLGFTQSQGIAGNLGVETGSTAAASATTQSHVDWRRLDFRNFSGTVKGQGLHSCFPISSIAAKRARRLPPSI